MCQKATACSFFWYNRPKEKCHLILKPDYFYSSLETIPLVILKDLGLRCLFVDVDNTLTMLKQTDLSDEKKEWLLQVANHDIRVFLISNNKGTHITELAKKTQLSAFEFAFKPFSKVYKHVQKTYHYKPHEIGVVGDQLFTDILGGNLKGYTTFYVEPLSSKDMIFTWFTRKIEGMLIAWWK
jgi:HAD superfamily phosphatase (TIGR01668 family)